jgi:hypothetical protein
MLQMLVAHADLVSMRMIAENLMVVNGIRISAVLLIIIVVVLTQCLNHNIF